MSCLTVGGRRGLASATGVLLPVLMSHITKARFRELVFEQRELSAHLLVTTHTRGHAFGARRCHNCARL